MERSARHAAALAALLALAAGAQAAEAPKVEKRTIEAKTAAYEIDAAYPQTGIKPIDEEVAAWVADEVAGFKKQAAPDPDSAAGAWTLDIGYSVERNDGQVLALLFTESVYTGGAHPGHTLRTYNYLLPDGRRVDVAQVVDGRKGLEKLSRLAIADLRPRLAGAEGLSDPDWIARGAGPDWANFENVLLLPDALKIMFPTYQVAPYVAGPQEVTIPFSALKGALRKDWRAPVASFDCAKAATPVERAVCADAALARLDREVAQAYAARLEAADPAGKPAIRAAQRAWLGRRDAACKDQADAALGACLTGLYRARAAELAPSP
jgi:uncharacterized protein YecT (DUF1311 family)